VDVIVSGPERPRRRRGRPVLRAGRSGLLADNATRLGRVRREVSVVVVALAAVAAVMALRTSAAWVEPRERAAAVGSPGPDGGQVLPQRPFDRLPGRTPIPAPVLLGHVGQDGQLVRGRLPAIGGPDRTTAAASGELVLGRYCVEPAMYALSVVPDRGWRQVTGFAFRMDRSADPPWVIVHLAWTGRAYVWTGSLSQLHAC
jgi:hypothetical protein